MMRVKNTNITGQVTGTAMNFGDKLTRITSPDFEGWFYTADLEPA
ncbi:hypothetical protein [Limnobaculum eriocheiris]|nr:hypothetical protein [Limnobaculum eriocheiris]